MIADHYKAFCTVISKGTATDCMTTVRLVHPKEYVHQGSRMVTVPVLIHWKRSGQGGIAPYTATAMFDDGKFCLSEFYWTDGNFGCDCNRSMACGLGDHVKCGSEIRISKIESLDPLIPSLELNETPD